MSLQSISNLILIGLFSLLVQTLSAQYSIIHDIRSGSSSSEPSDFAIFNGDIYFAANDGINGKELWKYDGANTPSMVADIRSGSSSSTPSNLMVFNNKLHFIANDGSTGTELWEYDGVNTPTRITDLAPGTGSGVRNKFVEYNGKLYFEALDFTNGFALWEYDGVNAPSLVSDIYAGDFYLGTGISELTVYNNKLYFAADDETVGYELWVYDGVNSPTLVQDINTLDDSFPEGLYVFNNKLYFNANDGVDGYELWEYDDGDVNSPSQVFDINLNGDAFPKNLTEFQNKLYFNANDGSNGQELWEYDGVNTPTLVSNIRSGSASSNPDQLIVYNNKLYFSADDGVTGIELWAYDGTNMPSQVDDLFSGPLNGKPDDLIVFDGKLMMEASDGSTGFEFWSYSAPSSCSCSAASPIPTTAGTYNSSCSTIDGDWKHFCDDNGNLLLSLNIGSSGAVVNDTEVSLQIQNPITSFHPFECGTSPACFIDIANGAVTFNRKWDVSPTTQPNSGNVGVRYYFSQADYNAVNTEINNQGQTQLTGMNQLWFYKVTNNALGQFPTIDELGSNDVQIIENHSTNSSIDQWILSTKTAGSEFIAEFEVTSFSGGGGGGAGAGAIPLPVELLYFEVNPLDYDAELKWATTSEINNDRFEVYKSLDGHQWDLFETVQGQSNSDINQYYQMIDKNPYWGINYYKLVQVDFDGTSTSLGIKSIDFSKNKSSHTKIFPNPVENTLNIIDTNGKAFIYDGLGRLLFQTTLNNQMNTVDVSSFNSGTFQLVILQENGKRITERFVK